MQSQKMESAADSEADKVKIFLFRVFSSTVSLWNSFVYYYDLRVTAECILPIGEHGEHFKFLKNRLMFRDIFTEIGFLAKKGPII